MPATRLPGAHGYLRNSHLERSTSPADSQSLCRFDDGSKSNRAGHANVAHRRLEQSESRTNHDRRSHARNPDRRAPQVARRGHQSWGLGEDIKWHGGTLVTSSTPRVTPSTCGNSPPGENSRSSATKSASPT